MASEYRIRYTTTKINTQNKDGGIDLAPQLLPTVDGLVARFTHEQTLIRGCDEYTANVAGAEVRSLRKNGRVSLSQIGEILQNLGLHPVISITQRFSHQGIPYITVSDSNPNNLRRVFSDWGMEYG